MNNQKPKDNPITPPYVILDTNVLSYLTKNAWKDDVSSFLVELTKVGYQLSISSITLYEILRGTNIKNEEEGLKLLSLFPRFDITENVLIASARLENLYKMESINEEKIDIGDRIIAATSILNGAIIFTVNAQDFPRPYFKEITVRRATRKDKKFIEMMSLYLLLPDIEMINNKFQMRS